ncbi:hypothetical protein COLO4_01444 [Corchorus olitorius]|uniref:Uncharacterized protein n=1 Tax=Corchorus olitorius TaxID=93759 RepID=A0A1R3L2L8_9ROSI|nr:hypothetical protein COLO4_01444 [Corchorus olitorius]
MAGSAWHRYTHRGRLHDAQLRCIHDQSRPAQRHGGGVSARRIRRGAVSEPGRLCERGRDPPCVQRGAAIALRGGHVDTGMGAQREDRCGAGARQHLQVESAGAGAAQGRGGAAGCVTVQPAAGSSAGKNPRNDTSTCSTIDADVASRRAASSASNALSTEARSVASTRRWRIGCSAELNVRAAMSMRYMRAAASERLRAGAAGLGVSGCGSAT